MMLADHLEKHKLVRYIYFVNENLSYFFNHFVQVLILTEYNANIVLLFQCKRNDI